MVNSLIHLANSLNHGTVSLKDPMTYGRQHRTIQPISAAHSRAHATLLAEATRVTQARRKVAQEEGLPTSGVQAMATLLKAPTDSYMRSQGIHRTVPFLADQVAEPEDPRFVPAFQGWPADLADLCSDERNLVDPNGRSDIVSRNSNNVTPLSGEVKTNTSNTCIGPTPRHSGIFVRAAMCAPIAA